MLYSLRRHNTLLWKVGSNMQRIILWSITLDCVVFTAQTPHTQTWLKVSLNIGGCKYIRYQNTEKYEELSGVIFFTVFHLGIGITQEYIDSKHIFFHRDRKHCRIEMEKLAAVAFHTVLLEDVHSVAEHLRQTRMFGLFIMGSSIKICDRCMGAAWPNETFTRIFTFLNVVTVRLINEWFWL